MGLFWKIASFTMTLAIVAQVVILSPQDLGNQSNLELLKKQERPEGFDQQASGVHLVEVQGEKLDWELWSDRADRQREENLWHLDSVLAKFYGENNTLYEVKGENGSVSEGKKDVQIQGKVKTTSSSGYEFETSQLRYQSKGRILYGPGPALIVGPKDASGQRMTLRGINLHLDVDKNIIQLEENVTAEKYVKDGQVKIRSRSARFNGKTREARFLGDVKIDYGDIKIRGPEAIFQFQSTKDQIDQVIVIGGVKVTDPLRSATAQKLTALFDSETLIFSGSPRVLQGDDELVGEEIIFIDRGERVQVKKARARFDPEAYQNTKDLSEGKKK